MGRSIVISDELYERLEGEARARGLNSIETLLQEWAQREGEILDRKQVVAKIRRLAEALQAKYGEMPDSADLIREDRELR